MLHPRILLLSDRPCRTGVVFAGFNGGMDMLQLIQAYHGVLPLYKLPFVWPAVRPMMLLWGCYLACEFHKELTAIYRGYESAGDKDTLFVKAMGADFWGPPPGCAEAEELRRSLQEGSGSRQGFGARVGGLGSESERNAAPQNSTAFGQTVQNWGNGTV